MREKLKEFLNSPRSIIDAFSAAVLFFCTVFTRLILKTDDGHFLGILHRNGFTVTSWLHERYTTVSGRIVGEWLMINFLRLRSARVLLHRDVHAHRLRSDVFFTF